MRKKKKTAIDYTHRYLSSSRRSRSPPNDSRSSNNNHSRSSTNNNPSRGLGSRRSASSSSLLHQQTPSRYEVRNREYLQQLSEQSRIKRSKTSSKLSAQELENKRREASFTTFFSGANQGKKKSSIPSSNNKTKRKWKKKKKTSTQKCQRKKVSMGLNVKPLFIQRKDDSLSEEEENESNTLISQIIFRTKKLSLEKQRKVLDFLHQLEEEEEEEEKEEYDIENNNEVEEEEEEILPPTPPSPILPQTSSTPPGQVEVEVGENKMRRNKNFKFTYKLQILSNWGNPNFISCNEIEIFSDDDDDDKIEVSEHSMKIKNFHIFQKLFNSKTKTINRENIYRKRILTTTEDDGDEDDEENEVVMVEIVIYTNRKMEKLNIWNSNYIPDEGFKKFQILFSDDNDDGEFVRIKKGIIEQANGDLLFDYYTTIEHFEYDDDDNNNNNNKEEKELETTKNDEKFEEEEEVEETDLEITSKSFQKLIESLNSTSEEEEEEEEKEPEDLKEEESQIIFNEKVDLKIKSSSPPVTTTTKQEEEEESEDEELSIFSKEEKIEKNVFLFDDDDDNKNKEEEEEDSKTSETYMIGNVVMKNKPQKQNLLSSRIRKLKRKSSQNIIQKLSLHEKSPPPQEKRVKKQQQQQRKKKKKKKHLWNLQDQKDTNNIFLRSNEEEQDGKKEEKEVMIDVNKSYESLKLFNLLNSSLKSDHGEEEEEEEKERVEDKNNNNNDGCIRVTDSTANLFKKNQNKLPRWLQQQQNQNNINNRTTRIKRRRSRRRKKRRRLKKKTEPETSTDNNLYLENYKTSEIQIQVLSNWGDENYIGLNGLEIFDSDGNQVLSDPELCIPSFNPFDDISKYSKTFTNDPRKIKNLVDGNNKTSNEFHLWLTPFMKLFGGESDETYNVLTLGFSRPIDFSMIRFWNYNKSRIHSSRGFKSIKIFVIVKNKNKSRRRICVWEGMINQAIGKVQHHDHNNNLDDYSTSVYFFSEKKKEKKISNLEKQQQQTEHSEIRYEEYKSMIFEKYDREKYFETTIPEQNPKQQQRRRRKMDKSMMRRIKKTNEEEEGEGEDFFGELLSREGTKKQKKKKEEEEEEKRPKTSEKKVVMISNIIQQEEEKIIDEDLSPLNKFPLKSTTTTTRKKKKTKKIRKKTKIRKKKKKKSLWEKPPIDQKILLKSLNFDEEEEMEEESVSKNTNFEYLECNYLKINILSNWGDKNNYYGITGLQILFLDDQEEERVLRINKKQIQLVNIDTHEPENINNLFKHVPSTNRNNNHHLSRKEEQDEILKNLTLDRSDMFQFQINNSSSSSFLVIGFPKIVKIRGIRIWNYNHFKRDVFRGLKFVKFMIGVKTASSNNNNSVEEYEIKNYYRSEEAETKKNIFMVSKAPGHVDYMYHQEIYFEKSKVVVSVPKKRRRSINNNKRNMCFRKEYITPLFPTGKVLSLHCVTNYGDPFYIGLNSIQLLDDSHLPLKNDQFKLFVCPESIKCFDDNNSEHEECRDSSKLLKYDHNNVFQNSWLSPFLNDSVSMEHHSKYSEAEGQQLFVSSFHRNIVLNKQQQQTTTIFSKQELHNHFFLRYQQQQNTKKKYRGRGFEKRGNWIYFVFDEPDISISMIKIWNYSKTPSRGVKKVEMFMDDVLIHQGVVPKASIMSSKNNNNYYPIFFTDDQKVVNRNLQSVGYFHPYYDMNEKNQISFYNDGIKMNLRGLLPPKKKNEGKNHNQQQQQGVRSARGRRMDKGKNINQRPKTSVFMGGSKKKEF